MISKPKIRYFLIADGNRIKGLVVQALPTDALRFHVKNHLSKMHRWLSVLIGIQLFLDSKGLILANPISQIRGEDNIKQPVKADLKEYELVDIHYWVNLISFHQNNR